MNAQVVADLVELVIRQAISPIAQRVKALEARDRAVADLQKQVDDVMGNTAPITSVQAQMDEHLMLLSAGMHADGVDEAVITDTLTWTRQRHREIAREYQRDVIATRARRDHQTAITARAT